MAYWHYSLAHRKAGSAIGCTRRPRWMAEEAPPGCDLVVLRACPGERRWNNTDVAIDIQRAFRPFAVVVQSCFVASRHFLQFLLVWCFL